MIVLFQFAYVKIVKASSLIQVKLQRASNPHCVRKRGFFVFFTCEVQEKDSCLSDQGSSGKQPFQW